MSINANSVTRLHVVKMVFVDAKSREGNNQNELPLKVIFSFRSYLRERDVRAIKRERPPRARVNDEGFPALF